MAGIFIPTSEDDSEGQGTQPGRRRSGGRQTVQGQALTACCTLWCHEAAQGSELDLSEEDEAGWEIKFNERARS